MASHTTTAAPAKELELGFSRAQGADWTEYLAFRPVYPAFFFERIYAYHTAGAAAAAAAPARWARAHDVGAGCGIVARQLAARFGHVVVSDPNDGYTGLARRQLVGDAGLPAGRLTFWQERAERSSEAAGAADLVAACECLHWTDTGAALREFRRQLRAGGTLVVTLYARPLIVGNAPAQDAMARIWQFYSERAADAGEWMQRALPIVNTGYEAVELPASDWGRVKRVYTNCRGTVDAFRMSNLSQQQGESRVGEAEEKIWIENDEDWCDEQDIKWFKGFFGTFVPKIPESDLQGLWEELEHALGGQKARMEFPNVMILATRK